jgi:hypothetical protein
MNDEEKEVIRVCFKKRFILFTIMVVKFFGKFVEGY